MACLRISAVQGLAIANVVVCFFREKTLFLDRAFAAQAPDLGRIIFAHFCAQKFSEKFWGSRPSCMHPSQERGGGPPAFRSGYRAPYTIPESVLFRGCASKIGPLISPVFYKGCAFLREKCTSLILLCVSKYHI